MATHENEAGNDELSGAISVPVPVEQAVWAMNNNSPEVLAQWKQFAPESWAKRMQCLREFSLIKG